MDELRKLGIKSIFGVFIQDTLYQEEVKSPIYLPNELFTGKVHQNINLTNLPGGRVNGTLTVEDSQIAMIWYLIFPLDANIKEIVAWLAAKNLAPETTPGSQAQTLVLMIRLFGRCNNSTRTLYYTYASRKATLNHCCSSAFFASIRSRAIDVERHRRCLHLISLVLIFGVRPLSSASDCLLLVEGLGRCDDSLRARYSQTTKLNQIYMRLLPIKFPSFSRPTITWETLIAAAMLWQGSICSEVLRRPP
jgi:hypothetical protein